MRTLFVIFSIGVDCAAILNKQFTSNGVYSISPSFANGGQIQVLCDMENGGWIVSI